MRITASTRRIIATAIIIPCLSVGVSLIYDYIASIPPDPATGEMSHVVGFMLSRHFNGLSPVDQKRYTETAMKRYIAMPESERQRVDARMAEMRNTRGDAMKEQAMRIWKNFVVAEAQQYVQLPPDQRSAWLQAKVAQWRMLGAPGDGPPGGGGRRAREQHKGALTPERQERIITFFQSEVFPRSTARERALVLILAKDAAPIMGQRR